jgi:hypothetical protein
MEIWTAMKRLNQSYDAWAIRAANKVVDDLDRRGAESRKPETKKTRRRMGPSL